MGRLSRDKRDVFYRLAKEKGYRARSAFKLLQLDAEFDLFGRHPGKNHPKVTRAVDLCAAPGSWSQVLADQLINNKDNNRDNYQDDTEDQQSDTDNTNSTSTINATAQIVAVDLQPMAPIDGVVCLQGDITSQQTAQDIIDHFHGEKAQLVLCDGAPDVTGLHDVDEFLQSQLLFMAILITTHVLEPGGTMVAKIFRGSNISLLTTQLRWLFDRVSVAKPTSSRNSSMEAFVVCQSFKEGRVYQNLPLDLGGYVDLKQVLHQQEGSEQLDKVKAAHATMVPFLACGDLSGWDAQYSHLTLDSDCSNPMMEDAFYLPPVAPPIQPPYQTSLMSKKQQQNQQQQSK